MIDCATIAKAMKLGCRILLCFKIVAGRNNLSGDIGTTTAGVPSHIEY